MSYASVTFHHVASVELGKTVWENGQAYLSISVKDKDGQSMEVTLYAMTSEPFDVLCPDKEEA
jgi:hypothetical protein